MRRACSQCGGCDHLGVRIRQRADEVGIGERVASLATRSIKRDSKMDALLLAIRMMDLTTLEGKDSPEKVRALCQKAVRPCDFEDRLEGVRVPAVAAV